MNKPPAPRQPRASGLALICLCVLAAIAVAGLWPFNPFPKNDVTWIGDQNGLRFSGSGIALTPSNIPWPPSSTAPTCSLELWLRPGQNNGVHDILTFYTRDTPQRLRIFNWIDGTLLIYRDAESPHREIDIEATFSPGVPLLITITGNSKGSAVYLNGMLKQTSTRLALSPSDLSGQLILGASPLLNMTWSGEIRGIAIYGAELSASQALQHFEAWSAGSFPPPNINEAPVALYAFSERSGNVAQSQMRAAPNLEIPESFQIPHERLLGAPSRNFLWSQSFFRDIIINVAGFAILGVVLYLYLAQKFDAKWPAPATIAIGATVSLTIELLQMFLPTRTSSIVDLAANTIGTAAGVLLCLVLLKPIPGNN